MSDMGTISEACETALAAADLTVRDGAAKALVIHYAALIDDAVRLAAEADRVWDELSFDDIDGRKRLIRVEAAVSAQSVASDLGPKLLAGLTALGCTLAGRGAKGREPERAADPQRTAHDELKAARDARKNGAKALDAASS